MKKSILLFFAAFTFIQLFSACTIEKRVYRPGYHIEWKTKRNFSPPEATVAGDKKTAEKAGLQQTATEISVITFSNSEKKGEHIHTDSILPQTPKDAVVPEKPLQANAYFASEARGVPIFTPQDIFTATAVESDDTPSTAAESEKFSKMAIAGFVCSVVGLLLLLIVGFPFLLGSLGIIFSAIGLKQTAGGQKKGRGLAIAGLVLGIIVVLISIIVVGIFVFDEVLLLE